MDDRYLEAQNKTGSYIRTVQIGVLLGLLLTALLGWF